MFYCRDYPEYRFHYLDYDRVRYLKLNVTHDSSLAKEISYPSELIYSLANLHVATEASGFVGTLSSSWCMMIQYLERTRGDAGYDYYSVDRGSSFTTCCNRFVCSQMRATKARQSASVLGCLPKYSTCSRQTVAAARSAFATSTPTYNRCGLALLLVLLLVLLLALAFIRNLHFRTG